MTQELITIMVVIVSAVTGLVTPFGIEMLKRVFKVSEEYAKRFVAFAVVLVVSALYAYATKSVDNFAWAFTVILPTQESMYAALYKDMLAKIKK